MSGVSDAPLAQFVGLLHRQVVLVAAVNDPVGVTVAASRRKHLSREALSITVHVVQAGSLKHDVK